MVLSRGITYDGHARWRMRLRQVTEEQVKTVLRTYHTSYPAKVLPGARFRSIIYAATIDGRLLRVYVREASDPPHVMTVAWEDEDE